MAYSDIQEKLGQQRMANAVLLAENYSQGNLFPRGSDERPYSKEPRAEGARKKRQFKKDQEAKKKAKEVSDNARQREWNARKKRGEVFGDMPPDFNLMETLGPSINTLLQIGGAVGGFLTSPLRNSMAMNFEDTGLSEGGFVSLDKPNIYINRGAEAHILEPNGNWKFDGFYDPARHGKVFPGLGLVQNQSNNNMKIASHDKPLFKTPPATGPRGDTMAPDWLIDYMNRKDENNLQIQDRLRRA